MLQGVAVCCSVAVDLLLRLAEAGMGVAMCCSVL